MLSNANLKIVIENPKGSYKSFQSSEHPEWNSYPLAGVTYPVDYGYITGYIGEDSHDLDVFVGTGEIHGYIKVWRMDIPEESKFFINLTEGELSEVLSVFKPVLLNHIILSEPQFC